MKTILVVVCIKFDDKCLITIQLKLNALPIDSFGDDSMHFFKRGFVRETESRVIYKIQ